MRQRSYLFAGFGSNPFREYRIEDGKAVTVRGWLFKRPPESVTLSPEVKLTPLRSPILGRIFGSDIGDFSIDTPSGSLVWTNVRGVTGVMQQVNNVALGKPEVESMPETAERSNQSNSEPDAIGATRPVTQPRTFDAPRWGKNEFAPEWLSPGEAAIERASALFHAGEPEALFNTDSPPALGKFVTSVFRGADEAESWNRSESINKLLVFQDWIVRCTRQPIQAPLLRGKFVWRREGCDCVWFTGIPLSFVTRLDWREGNRLVVFGVTNIGEDSAERDVLNGEMRVAADEKVKVISLFNDLRARGRLHARFARP